ncbi:uncharacterized protein LOC119865241 isoform X15 [Canis lupus familiaris]|uniref:uncharacterized protein LOC119865241 isoform X15 n=1 Tax=Canis lupus familiaris TaxID=9615 RepID=UPI0018F3EEBC|nr:uncharacterized protein LOC119865241 isoform X15 [Canis lupus familiaris]
MAGNRGVTVFVLLLSCWHEAKLQPINMTSVTRRPPSRTFCDTRCVVPGGLVPRPTRPTVHVNLSLLRQSGSGGDAGRELVGEPTPGGQQPRVSVSKALETRQLSLRTHGPEAGGGGQVRAGAGDSQAVLGVRPWRGPAGSGQAWPRRVKRFAPRIFCLSEETSRKSSRSKPREGQHTGKRLSSQRRPFYIDFLHCSRPCAADESIGMQIVHH